MVRSPPPVTPSPKGLISKSTKGGSFLNPYDNLVDELVDVVGDDVGWGCLVERSELGRLLLRVYISLLQIGGPLHRRQGGKVKDPPQIRRAPRRPGGRRGLRRRLPRGREPRDQRHARDHGKDDGQTSITHLANPPSMVRSYHEGGRLFQQGFEREAR